VKQPLRVGVVGATFADSSSRWGVLAHAPALRALRSCELTAVCTAHERTARESALALGARLAFHDVEELVACPEIDLVAIVVRVPRHHELASIALRAGKAVFCEWPMAASLGEARAMARLASAQRAQTAVGLQARSDPSILRARELLRGGIIGEVLSANLYVIAPGQTERPAGRLWQGVRANGANVLTIAGGHAIDALSFVLGEISGLQARVATRVSEWTNADTGELVRVDAPDTVSLIGWLEGGIEVAAQIVSLPSRSPSSRLEINGREGTMTIAGPLLNVGPSRVLIKRGTAEPYEELAADLPSEVGRVPAGPARNVAAQYARLASAWDAGDAFHPDFADGLRTHEILAAIEESAGAA